MAGVIQTAKRSDWGTPDWLVNAARKAFGGRIDLDPAGNPARLLSQVNETLVLPGSSPVQGQGTYIFADGLDTNWKGNVFVNPPYGRGLGRWIAKAAEETRAGVNVIALLPAYTSLAAWQVYVPEAMAVCFLRQRVKFEGSKYGAAFSSAVVLWGDDFAVLAGFFREFEQHGQVVPLFQRRRTG